MEEALHIHTGQGKRKDNASSTAVVCSGYEYGYILRILCNSVHTIQVFFGVCCLFVEDVASEYLASLFLFSTAWEQGYGATNYSPHLCLSFVSYSEIMNYYQSLRPRIEQVLNQQSLSVSNFINLSAIVSTGLSFFLFVVSASLQ